ncbi:hypothetical protein [Accumulibacter sp.]|uniref:hypothetical protein n=1 Tax=Accumulibacter sp. TaxID=2053492 RepID=UPI002615B24A|nr:hypothetical protein [Accumulibacter sp.]
MKMPDCQHRSDAGWRTADGRTLRANGTSHHAIPETTSAGSSAGEQPDCMVLAHWQLPTMQKNALRKVFKRPDFTPGEVAQLGHRRLERAEGIGSKGLAKIVDWLRCQGYELADDTRSARSRDLAASAKEVTKLKKAMRVLQTHGYTVLREQPSADDKNCCARQ